MPGGAVQADSTVHIGRLPRQVVCTCSRYSWTTAVSAESTVQAALARGARQAAWPVSSVHAWQTGMSGSNCFAAGPAGLQQPEQGAQGKQQQQGAGQAGWPVPGRH